MNRVYVGLFIGEKTSATVNGNDVNTCGADVRRMLEQQIDELTLVDTPPYRERRFVSIERHAKVLETLRKCVNYVRKYDQDAGHVLGPEYLNVAEVLEDKP